MRDHLYLLAPDFADPALPGRRFYCWHCALIEGCWRASRPRAAARRDAPALAAAPGPLVSRLGEAHQVLPVLVLAPDAPDGLATGRRGPVRFVDDKDAILRVLHARHGFPEAHP